MAQYQHGGYGGGANPFDERNNAPEQGGYGAHPYRQQSPQYGAPAMGGQDEYAGRNVEMEPLRPNGAEFGNGPGDSKLDPELLAQLKQIDEEIKNVAGPSSAALKLLQTTILNNPDPGADLTRKRNQASDDIMQEYTRLVDKTRRLKSNPKYASNKVLGKISRDLKNAMEDFQRIDVDFAKKLQEQMARQYRIVRPEASDAEVKDAVEGQSHQQQQMFSQALMQSNRRGQAQSVMSAVQTRHDEIKRIESQMEDLAKLFIDLATLVEQQEAPIANIEIKGEEVVENMDKGNAQIGTAIQSARNTRKWKWWCLGIVVLIIAIIVIIVLIYKFVIQNNNTSKPASKRFVLPSLERRAVSAPTEERSEIPGLKWTRENTLAPVEERWVVDKLEWSPPSKKERRFQA
ncbi:Protein transport protein SSO2 [Lachnellula cervina]|uniref:Protein transport protein SSO2 n=1 Tax=Lachnellula cervina TaxID=1316786 RepID=A0A7D8UMG4_9HELO|nr:Protein transport protein SSO2 [Lachnellula cervina]